MNPNDLASAPRQHTPGPWDVEPKGSRHFVDGADGLTVAYLDRAGVRERIEIDANARLIAAAPELLAALENLCDAVQRHHTQGQADFGPDYARAVAAIARATSQPAG